MEVGPGVEGSRDGVSSGGVAGVVDVGTLGSAVASRVGVRDGVSVTCPGVPSVGSNVGDGVGVEVALPPPGSGVGDGVRVAVALRVASGVAAVVALVG